jgi:uncharacterized protein YnzC (UPF0291/DUF896 family)
MLGKLVLERNDLAKKETAGILSEFDKIRLKELELRIEERIEERNPLALKEKAGTISEAEKIRLKELRIELYNPPPIKFTLPRVACYNEL